MRSIALANKRPGGVEVNIMAGKGMGMDKFESGKQTNPTKEDLETYRIVFELFDRDKGGFIDAQDLAAISIKLNRDPEEGKISFNKIRL